MKIQNLSVLMAISALAVLLLVLSGAAVVHLVIHGDGGGDVGIDEELKTPVEAVNENIEPTENEKDVASGLSDMNLNSAEGSTKAHGGQILWTASTVADEPLSTPAIADLNGDGDMEVVIASAGDAIYAFNPDGTEFWDHPYTDDVIEYLGIAGFDGIDFEPPHIFSSVTVADIDMGSDPEIIVGVKDGALCLRANGDLHWKKGKTTGYYFSTCGITDLEGEWTGTKDDLEVIMASDDASRNGWLEAFAVDGGSIFREEVTCGGEGGLIGCSIATKDLDGSFEDGNEPYEGEEVDTELIVGNHDYGMRIYKRAGNQANGNPNYDEKFDDMLAGHQTYATPAIGNFSGDEACEIITASCEGFQVTWEGWGGKVYAYTPSGDLLWDFATGSSRAGIISSPSVADVHCAKNDPGEKELDYEIFFGCDNGKLYCLDADHHAELWSYDTGGRVMSSPAICNIDADDELEVIIGSDSGKVYCFDGDPSDGDDDGESVPGDGSSHDLLWVTDIGNPVGISSPVVGDINLDGTLEVIIGDEMGNVYCIDAGGRCVRGQNDWPMFHYDTNKTGYYNPQTSFGVDLYPWWNFAKDPPSPCKMIKDVEPGKSVKFNITVKNTGKAHGSQATDVIYLSIDGVPEGWNARLIIPPDMGNPNPDYVRLKVDETKNITLIVTAPWEAEIGELARINVTGNSSNDPFVRDTISTITLINIKMDLEIGYTKEVDEDQGSPYYGIKWGVITPGASGMYGLIITNTGNCNDTYEIKLTGVPEGWTAYFVETGTDTIEVSLMSSIFEEFYNDPQSTTVYIKVECPMDASLGEEAWIKATATSLRSLATGVGGIEVLQEWDELLLVAKGISDVYLDCEEPVRYISPGGSVVFEIIVENLSNDEITVLLSHNSLLGDWTADYKEEVDLLIGQKVKVNLVIWAPENAPADLRCVFTFTGKIKDKTNLQSTVALTAIVSHEYGLDVAVEPEKTSADPGDEVAVGISIRNLGNGRDVITPTPYDVELGWNVSFQVQGFVVTHLDLLYNQTLDITMRMRIPADTIAKRYMVGINISGMENTVIKYIRVNVNQTYDLKVVPYPLDPGSKNPQRAESAIDPGRIVPFMAEVRNSANGPDRINLTLEGLDDNWNAWFGAVANTPDYTRNVRYIDFDEELFITTLSPDINYLPNSSTVKRMTLYLPTEQTAWVTVYIQAPTDAPEDAMKTISIKGESSGGAKDDRSNNKASLDLTVLYADLIVNGFIEISKPGGGLIQGEITTVSANIRNVGDIEAVNVVVVLKVDGKEVKRAVVKRVLVDQDQLVTFSWKVESGKHEIKIEIDPENTVIEKNDQTRGINNNVKTADAKAEWKPIRDLTEVSTVLLPLFLLLLVIAAVGIAAMLYLKKKQQQEQS